MKLFGKLTSTKIPSDDRQVVEVLQSWTVSWVIRTDSDYRSMYAEKYSKVFISQAQANEFIKQLKEAAAFIKCKIFTSISEN